MTDDGQQSDGFQSNLLVLTCVPMPNYMSASGLHLTDCSGRRADRSNHEETAERPRNPLLTVFSRRHMFLEICSYLS